MKINIHARSISQEFKNEVNLVRNSAKRIVNRIKGLPFVEEIITNKKIGSEEFQTILAIQGFTAVTSILEHLTNFPELSIAGIAVGLSATVGFTLANVKAFIENEKDALILPNAMYYSGICGIISSMLLSNQLPCMSYPLMVISTGVLFYSNYLRAKYKLTNNKPDSRKLENDIFCSIKI